MKKSHPRTRHVAFLLLLLWSLNVLTVVRSLEVVVEESSEGAVLQENDDVTETEETDATTAPAENNEADAPATNSNNMRCRWGEHCPPQQQQDQEEGGINLTAAAAAAASSSTTTLPFFPPKVSNVDGNNNVVVPHYKPPEGFVLTARVYTDSEDKKAHFDSEGTSLVLPYWECGAVGSTTFPLQVKHAYFRHSLGHTTVSSWSGTEYGPHPHLLIPLTPLELVLNSGESKVLDAGNVVLLEDVLSSGHKMKGIDGDVDALIVTLPQHFHYVGKERSSLHMTKTSDASQAHPCPNDDGTIVGGDTTSASRGWMIGSGSASKTTRQVVFGSLGAAMSGMTALFLTKVAPLWLSVGIGGTCFVVGGTGAAVVCGEAIVEHVQTVMERKRLEQQEVELLRQQEQPESSAEESDLKSATQDMDEHFENPILQPEIMDHLMNAEETIGGR